MSGSKAETLQNLLAIFEIRQKAELEAHARVIAFSKSDLANLIIACQCEAITLKHIPIFRHHHPSHLHLNDENLKAFASSKVGRFAPDAQKVANKIFQSFEQRRLFNGHMFWPPHIEGHWHLFYFDQRDVSEHNNHWRQGGRHIHLMNMLTHPQLDPNHLLENLFRAERPKLGGGLHIRWIDENQSE